jgi:hypothetical protein
MKVEYQFVMHLHDHAAFQMQPPEPSWIRIMAILIISAADPGWGH